MGRLKLETVTHKVCARCVALFGGTRSGSPVFVCRGCGARCCEHLSALKDEPTGAATCTACRIARRRETL